MASLPYDIQSGNDAEAEPVQANFDAINVRVNSVESIIDNIVVDANTYGNGVFPDGLAASQVGTTLVYTSGSAVVNHQTYYKTTITVDFLGKGVATYYVELDTAGNVAIYTGTDSARTNLNTVVWNGSGFTTVTEANRNVLATYQEIIDARDTEDTLEDRLDKIEDGTRREDKITTQTTASLTLDNTHKNINFNTTTNAIAVTVPLANSNLGRSYLLYVGTAVSAHDVTVSRSSTDVFIHNGTEYTGMAMTHYDYVEIIAVASGVWLIKAQYGVLLS